MFSHKPAPNVSRIHNDFQQKTMFLVSKLPSRTTEIDVKPEQNDFYYDNKLEKARKTFKKELHKYDAEYSERMQELYEDRDISNEVGEKVKKEMDMMIEQREKEAYRIKRMKSNQAYDQYTAKKHEIKELMKGQTFK